MSDGGLFTGLIELIRDHYGTDEAIPLHAPVFVGKEREYVLETIDTSYVSSVGSFVDRFEDDIKNYTGSERAVATMNGTAALHIAMKLAGVKAGDLVITQPLTFVATCNAISYCAAEPVFIDVDLDTMGLSPLALEEWLRTNAMLDCDGVCRTQSDDRPIRACVPMHTFGHPAHMDGIMAVCKNWRITVIEDAAESLGSMYKGRHTGAIGDIGTLSFNGNKILTTGGGGMVLCDEATGIRAKHLTTTAKKPHAYEYFHDEVGYNYRLPNLNAALGCAQLEQLDAFVSEKRALAEKYREFLEGSSLGFFVEPADCRSNYWLNAAICSDRDHRDALLQATNRKGVMTRPIWTLMTHLPFFEHCRHGNLVNAEWLEARVVNLPSSASGYPK